MIKDLEKYTLGHTKTIKDALVQIEKNKSGFVLILKNDTVVGTITDGDIRRALIESSQLRDEITGTMRSDFTYVTEKDNLSTIIDYFKSEKYSFLPIISLEKKTS